MALPPIIARVTIDSIEPIVQLFIDRKVSLSDTGVQAKQGAGGSYTNGNTKLLGCTTFTLEADGGTVAYDIGDGATITFYRKPEYGGGQTLCLIEDHAGERTFSITGELRCKVRDTRPVRPPVPLPLREALGI